MGLEPTAFGATNRRSNRLSYTLRLPVQQISIGEICWIGSTPSILPRTCGACNGFPGCGEQNHVGQVSEFMLKYNLHLAAFPSCTGPQGTRHPRLIRRKQVLSLSRLTDSLNSIRSGNRKARFLRTLK